VCKRLTTVEDELRDEDVVEMVSVAETRETEPVAMATDDVL